MVRNIVAIVVGLVAGFLVAAGGLALGNYIYPVPEDLNTADIEAMKAFLSKAPVGQLLFVIASEFAGATVAITLTGIIARHQIICGVLVGIFFLGAAVVNLISIPHPQWMAVATPFVYTIAVFCGLGFAAWISDRSTGNEFPPKPLGNKEAAA